MLVVFSVLLRALELLALLPFRILHLLLDRVAFNPRLGPLRYVAGAGIAYVCLALLLVYVAAPIRGVIGHYTLGEKLHYDAERWLATAIYDARGSFVGTFDPRLDSLRDVNYTGEAIDLGDYVANPDHKSIPVRTVPDHYWQCLVYHEDRNLGGLLNPFGIDLPGVLKIPFSTIRRSIAARRPVLGVGGSTLAMQFVRVIYKTPPDVHEGAVVKLKRKFGEWWLAPVVYRELTDGGDNTALKQWAANHLWLAQRTGGSPLHGIELASRIVFGKETADLSIAEQFVLASAVNRPIILMEGSERLNAVRLDRWRYLTEVRARTCAEKLIPDEAEQKQVVFELVAMAAGPPDPKIKPKLQEALEKFAPGLALPAQANPVIRANALMPAARYGIREEMKQRYGFAWRDHVRGITTTFDAVSNLAFGETARQRLAEIDAKYGDKIDAGYTLDPAKIADDRHSPGVIIAAANANGEIVRYFEQGETASYFGSPFAREAATGYYDRSRESRMVASTGKIIAAIAIANTLRDTPQSLYVDAKAPAQGLETCARGDQRHGRTALVAFACSLNDPLMSRTARVGQARLQKLIAELGFNMPPTNADGSGTPPSTAIVLGQVAGCAAARAPPCRHRAGEPDRPRSDAPAGADADQALRLHRRRQSRRRPDRHDHPQQDHPRRRPRLHPLRAAGAALLRGRRQARRHPEGSRRLVRCPPSERQAALRQDRHASDGGRRRHGRCMDRRRTAVRQRRRLFLCRRCWYRLYASSRGRATCTRRRWPCRCSTRCCPIWKRKRPAANARRLLPSQRRRHPPRPQRNKPS